MKRESLQELAGKQRAVFDNCGIQRAIVFGSLARGEPSRRSDLDLLVIQKTDKRFLDRYDGILSEITEVVRGRDVDLLIYTPEELQMMSDRLFIRTALKEGIVIYESEPESTRG